jgi:hypothetical protein
MLADRQARRRLARLSVRPAAAATSPAAHRSRSLRAFRITRRDGRTRPRQNLARLADSARLCTCVMRQTRALPRPERPRSRSGGRRQRARLRWVCGVIGPAGLQDRVDCR